MGSNHSNEKSEKNIKNNHLGENNDSLKKEILSFSQWEEEPKIKNDICSFFTCCKSIEVLKPHSQVNFFFNFFPKYLKEKLEENIN